MQRISRSGRSWTALFMVGPVSGTDVGRIRRRSDHHNGSRNANLTQIWRRSHFWRRHTTHPRIEWRRVRTASAEAPGLRDLHRYQHHEHLRYSTEILFRDSRNRRWRRNLALEERAPVRDLFCCQPTAQLWSPQQRLSVDSSRLDSLLDLFG